MLNGIPACDRAAVAVIENAAASPLMPWKRQADIEFEDGIFRIAGTDRSMTFRKSTSAAERDEILMVTASSPPTA